jgi:hypothetical protein
MTASNLQQRNRQTLSAHTVAANLPGLLSTGVATCRGKEKAILHCSAANGRRIDPHGFPA